MYGVFFALLYPVFIGDFVVLSSFSFFCYLFVLCNYGIFIDIFLFLFILTSDKSGLGEGVLLAGTKGLRLMRKIYRLRPRRVMETNCVNVCGWACRRRDGWWVGGDGKVGKRLQNGEEEIIV